MRRTVEDMSSQNGGTPSHISVLKEEVIDFLQIQPGGTYLDATVGAGGDSEAIASLLESGLLIGLDKDPAAIELASKRLAPFGPKVVLKHASYTEFARILDELFVDKLDGVIADLGVSSMQIDSTHRGFSFQYDTPLDLRFDNTRGKTAAELLTQWSKKDLADLIRKYGEERFAGRIAAAIVKARSEGIRFTGLSLREIIHRTVPAKYRFQGKIDCATRTFQALRLATNHELEELDLFLDLIIDRLKPGARIVVISFHSLEDRIVKRRFRAWENPCNCPKSIPHCVCGAKPRVRVVTRRAVKAGETELEMNPRSRSARLRVAETLQEQTKIS